MRRDAARLEPRRARTQPPPASSAVPATARCGGLAADRCQPRSMKAFVRTPCAKPSTSAALGRPDGVSASAEGSTPTSFLTESSHGDGVARCGPADAGRRHARLAPPARAAEREAPPNPFHALPAFALRGRPCALHGRTAGRSSTADGASRNDLRPPGPALTPY